ncbi:MAG: hypothetical protein GY928_16195 [Colwellia sp.]|nr:hypothetical protein [Colwellia sp.]
MNSKESKRDRDSYHLVLEEAKKVEIVKAILKSLGTKKTHKYHPTSITELANKVKLISKEYVYVDGENYPMSKSALLRPEGKYRDLLDSFFASLSGKDSLKLNVSVASEEALRVMVRTLQHELAESRRENDIFVRRIQNQTGSTFDPLPESNSDELKDQQNQQQEIHDAYVCIFNILSYLKSEKLALLNFTNEGLVEPLTDEVVIQKNTVAGYLQWFEEQSKASNE